MYPERKMDGIPFPDVDWKKQTDEQGDETYSYPASQIPEGVTLAQMNHIVPGSSGEIRIVYWQEASEDKEKLKTIWAAVDSDRDFTHQFTLTNLKPGASYQFEAESRASESGPKGQKISGSFRTPPAPEEPARVVFTVVTGQGFHRRDDGEMGHRIYPRMAELNPDFFVHTGDILYYDKRRPVAQSVEQAVTAARDMFAGQFGAAGREVVVEEFLPGEEASYLALVDGEHVLPLETAQDHKAVGEGDSGPNTGGMGAYSPAPVMTPALCETVRTEIVEPLVRAMAADGAPFKGVFYAGLMISDGAPKLLEVNVRFGDPECQAILPRLHSDLFAALRAARDGRLGEIELEWRQQAALCVVMASKGYPGAYEKGSIIRGIEAAEAATGATVFHAGTRRDDGKITAVGGRVLGVTALGDDIAKAQATAYRAVERIDWPGGFYRRDIGWRAVGR